MEEDYAFLEYAAKLPRYARSGLLRGEERAEKPWAAEGATGSGQVWR